MFSIRFKRSPSKGFISIIAGVGGRKAVTVISFEFLSPFRKKLAFHLMRVITLSTFSVKFLK